MLKIHKYLTGLSLFSQGRYEMCQLLAEQAFFYYIGPQNSGGQGPPSPRGSGTSVSDECRMLFFIFI